MGLTNNQQALFVFISAIFISLGSISIPANFPTWVTILFFLLGSLGWALKEYLGSAIPITVPNPSIPPSTPIKPTPTPSVPTPTPPSKIALSIDKDTIEIGDTITFTCIGWVEYWQLFDAYSDNAISGQSTSTTLIYKVTQESGLGAILSGDGQLSLYAEDSNGAQSPKITFS
jgi:hypothetical protein